MSEPAKDEAELLRRIEEQSGWDGQWLIAPVDALAAIRAAGWAVVPQTKLDCLRADNALLLASFMEKAAEELEKVYDMYCSNQHQHERDMELPRAIRAMLAAAPGVKP
jgi:hypothetical protein